MRSRWYSLGAIVVVASMLLVGGVASESGAAKADKLSVDKDGTITYVSATGAPISLDPVKTGARQIAQLVYDGLLTIGWEHSSVPLADPQPELATAWKFADDGSYIDFTLRKDVKFHDGTPFNADAVKVNIERGKNTAGSALAGALSSISTVSVVDPYTVRFNLLPGRGADVPWQMALGGGTMISPKALADGTNVGLSPGNAGSGPYLVTSYTPGQNLKVERAPDYWNSTKNGLAKVFDLQYVPDGATRLNALKAGQANAAFQTFENYPDTLAAFKAGQISPINNLDPKTGTSPNPVAMYQIWLRPTGDMADVRVREAASLAVNRDAICKTISNNLCTVPSTLSWYPTSSPWFNKDATKTEYNPTKAKKLLKEAGVTNPKLEIVMAPGTPPSATTPAVQSDLEKVGFQVSITQKPAVDALTAFKAGTGQSMAWAGSNWYDPSALMDLFYVNGYKLTPPDKMAQVTDLANQGTDPALSQAERAKVYAKAFKIVQDQYISIDLSFVTLAYASANNVRTTGCLCVQDLRGIYVTSSKK